MNEPEQNRQFGWLVYPIHGNLLLICPRNPSPVVATRQFSQKPSLINAGQGLNYCSPALTEGKQAFVRA